MQDNTPVERDTTRLLDQAAAKPGEQDQLGIVGFGSTWLAASIYIKSHMPVDSINARANDAMDWLVSRARCTQGHQWNDARPVRMCTQCGFFEVVN